MSEKAADAADALFAGLVVPVLAMRELARRGDEGVGSFVCPPVAFGGRDEREIAGAAASPA
jgi:hypothetical protein